MSIHMYNVGFGDCFLLEFAYRDAATRWMLIDCGTFRAPGDVRESDHLAAVAADVARRCNSRLDVLVATHRHADHICGFKGKSGDIFAALEPKRVLQPWTEEPGAPPAGLPESSPADSAMARRGLATGQLVIDAILERMARREALPDRDDIRPLSASHLGDLAEIARIASLNISNKEAVETLARLGLDGRARYLKAGDDPELNDILPGVRIDVLGPPDLEQWPEIRKQVANHEEFWLRMADALQSADPDLERRPIFDEQYVDRGRRAWHGWIIDRMRDADIETTMALVTSLDKALNNTSLVLLVTVGKKSFLFPGDAQIESWNFIRKHLDRKRSRIANAIRNCDVYKVGHHGSRNATPKFLWKLWEARRADGRAMPISLLSTRGGVHGSGDHAVPSPNLMGVLSETELHSTEALPATGVHSMTIEIA
ncbi:MBL fold metallo-hydrolase [Aquibium sp. ELW1220]|uniref:MBL fold metallo-hydrolase n=1 Tax=Aquibium sp. ELW1220 TaxID=2976766 RepID=UPI0025AF58C5|nr:MBL fold metallo-hydrolase [Aquibium sp. ELW1220]MDN2580153.1 hypothetical protein [Aquibium sp. ELW1220]